MQNLAGNKNCDREIRRELERARIDVVEGQATRGEVPYTITGSLAGWTFERAWYYWVAKGQLPLEIAKQLYADPIGKTDVRVAGHCGCPPPEPPWVTCYDAEGNQLWSDPDGEEARKAVGFVERGLLKAEQFAGQRFVPDAPSVAARIVVESYHIDSEAGLRLFADALRSLEAAA